MSNWGSFPKWWVGEELLTQLHAGAGDVGANLAALKLYLCIAVHAEFQTRRVQLSFDDFEAATKLSRPMLRRGLDVLTLHGLVKIEATRPATYEMVQAPGSKHFVQVPGDTLKAALKALPNRGASSLNALKLLIVLCHLRPFDGTTPVKVSHARLQELTGIRPNAVRQALDHLVNHRLVHIHQDDYDHAESGRPVNRYQVLGIVDRRKHGPGVSAGAVAAALAMGTAHVPF